MSEKLRAVVVCVGESQRKGKASDMREILQIASKLVKMREKTLSDVPILEVVYIPRLQAYVYVYDRMASSGRSERKGNEK